MEMQFVFDDDEARLSPPMADEPRGVMGYKRQLEEDCSRSSSGDDTSRSVSGGWPARNFGDLTFKEVPDCDEASLSDVLLGAVQPSAAICIPQSAAVNGQAADAAQAAGRRRNKKRRPLELGRPRRFDELYEATGEQLGAGAYGTVATYRDRRTQREFAVKRIEKRSYSIRARIFKEIEIFNACAGHPHVVQLIEFYETDKEFYLVFEKMSGGTLLQAIQDRGRFSEAEARDVVHQLAEALSLLHKRGIAHRDLKPENILCELPGQLRPVKIGDFDLGSDVPLARRSRNPSSSGSASAVGRTNGSSLSVMDEDADADSTSTPQLLTPVGSLEYMAPEVVDTWMGEASMYDKKCDIWSLGVILYILLSGKPPFYGQCGQQCGWDEGGSCYTCQTMLCEKIQRGEYEFSERDWRGVSAEAIDLVRRMLVREPHKRASADEVLQHDWFTLPLRTVRPLDMAAPRRSLAGLASYAENANAWNRLFAQQLYGAPCSVSCYLPSPHLDDRLSELLELEAEPSVPLASVSVSAQQCDAESPDWYASTAQPQQAPSAHSREFESASLANGEQLLAAMYAARLRPRLGSGAAALAHVARRRRLSSRSSDASLIGVPSWLKHGAAERFAHGAANHREPIEVRE